jgi:hypothetical protein
MALPTCSIPRPSNNQHKLGFLVWKYLNHLATLSQSRAPSTFPNAANSHISLSLNFLSFSSPQTPPFNNKRLLTPISKWL